MRRPHLQVGAVTITSEFGKARELADFYHQLLDWPIVDVGPKGGWLQAFLGAGFIEQGRLGRARAVVVSGADRAKRRVASR